MNRRLVTAGVAVGLFLAAIEGTVVGTAMPTVIAHLQGVKLYSLVFAAYMLTSTVTLPLWGKLSDRYGRRGSYAAGTLTFALGSALSGLAQTMPQLVAFRALQGIGAGAVVPLGFTIVGEIYTLEERARVQGVLSGVWGIASVVGPVVGGFLTQEVSWRAVFYMPVPFGCAAAAIVLAAYRGAPRAAGLPLDLAGAGVLTAAATLLLGAAGLAGRPGGLADPAAIGCLLGAVALAALFVRIERRAADPIVHLDLFRLKIFTATTCSGLFAGMAMFGTVSFTPLFVQAVIGTDAIRAGATLTPFMLAWVVSSTVGARLALRWGYRVMAVGGMVSLAIGVGYLGTLGAAAGFRDVCVAMALAGLGMGASFTPLLIAIQSAVARERLGVATSTVTFFRSMGGAIGVAALGAILTAHIAGGPLPEGVTPESIVDPILRQRLTPEQFAAVRGALASGLAAVFHATVFLALAALAASTTIPGGRAREHAQEAAAEPAAVGH
jgi:EmrB/QacA subfamily drug resistance transporter